MASAQVSFPEPEEDVKDEEVPGEDTAKEGEAEKLDPPKPVSEENQDPFEEEDKEHGEEEEEEQEHGGITEAIGVGAKFIGVHDGDEFDTEGEGAEDEDASHLQ